MSVPGEIAEAFVLIRPVTTGFKAQTDGAVRTAALSAAKLFAGVFAGVELFKFGKSAVNEAAQTQKATEAIKAGFGESSDAVLQFSDDAAKSFGISKQASEEFSSTLSVTARSLGLTGEQTATMSIGLQKLAGSVGQIKGIDPASVFDKLSLALAGNTRGLKSLGIVADSASIKQAALDNHIVKATVDSAKVEKATLAYHDALRKAADAVDKYGKGSVEATTALNDVKLKQDAVKKATDGTVPALDKAQKAQAIYAIATQDLGKFQEQAGKNSDDLRNKQIELSAEWSNAKEEIGSALLPAVTSLAGSMISLLEAVARNKGGIKEAFSDAALVLTPITFAVKELAHNMDVVKPIVAGVGGAVLTYKAAMIAAQATTALMTATTKAYGIASLVARGQVSLIAPSAKSAAAATQELAAAQGVQIASTEGVTAAIEAEDAAALTSIGTKDAEVVATQAVVGASEEEAGAILAASEAVVGESAVQAAALEGAAAAAVTSAATVVAAEEGVVAETEVMSLALASNPFGLLALGVSAVVGGFIGYKVLAGESSDATNELADSLKAAKDASNDFADAMLELKTGNIDLRQANLDHAEAVDTLAAAQRTVNGLARDGKKGTEEYRQAQQDLTRAQIDLDRSNVRIANSEAGIDKAREDGKKGRQDFIDQLVKSGDAAKKAAEDSGKFNLQLTKSPAAAAAVATAKAADAAQRFATATLDAATEQAHLAQKMRNESNPAAAAGHDKLELLAIAAKDVAAKIHDVPTQKQINLFYKQNPDLLKRQAEQLNAAIRNIPKESIFDIALREHISVSRVISTHKGGSGFAGMNLGAGEIGTVGEQGEELTVSGSQRQVISHAQSVGLFKDLAASIDHLAENIQKPSGGGSPVTVIVDGSKDPEVTANAVVNRIALSSRR